MAAEASNIYFLNRLEIRNIRLPPGVVCDACNNYFASNIERPVLESQHFVTARFNALIPNKRGKMPLLPAMLMPVTPRSGARYSYPAEVTRGANGDFYMEANLRLQAKLPQE